MDGTIIGQGSFIAPATIVNQIIVIPSGVDRLCVQNYTQFGTAAAAATGTGIEFIWQRGMAAGTGIVKYKINTTDVNLIAGDTLVSGGFTLYDPSGQSTGSLPLLGPQVATTVQTDATRPAITTTSTAGLSVGSVVRVSNSAQTDVNGIDMVVGTVTDATHFTLLTASNALANDPGIAGGDGFYRIVNTRELFYPRKRVITNITQAINGQVSTSIAHGLTPGQEVRFNIPAICGMIQLNPDILNNYFPTGSSASAIVQTVVDDYNFTININTLAYTAFTYPLYSQTPCSFPEVTPFGEDTATSLSILGAQVPTIGGIQIYNTNTGLLADSTVNTGFLGMVLGTGGFGHTATMAATAITGPAGSVAGDVLYWVAYKSTYGGL